MRADRPSATEEKIVACGSRGNRVHPAAGGVRDAALAGVWLLAAVLFALAVFAPISAQAAQRHGFRESFGEPGVGSGQLSLRPVEQSSEGRVIGAGSGVAVDDETGDVYVADTENHRVSEFDPAKPPGERFIRAFGAEVGGAGVDVCTSSCAPGTAGTAPGRLQAPTFIAVDNDPSSSSHGDVYVADTAGAENRVTKFDALGNLIASWGTGGQLDGAAAEHGPFDQIQGIGVDPAGDLWVQGGSGGAHVFEFDQAGGFVPEDWDSLSSHQPGGIALDGSGHLYALEGFQRGPIKKFTTSGTLLGAVFGAEGMFFTGIAADQSTHDLYADQEGVAIAVIAAACVPGPGTAGACAPGEVFGEGSLDSGAGIAVDGSDATVYAASTADEQIATFSTTLEALTGAAGAIGGKSALLHGTVDPKQTPVTRCAFQYGPTISYGSEVGCLDGAGEEVGTQVRPITVPTEVHADLAGLSGGSVYHFRLRVVNEQREGLSSEDGALETSKLAAIEEAEATEITASSATLSAEVDPEGVAGTTCAVEWATEAEWNATKTYGTSVPCEPQTLGGSSPIPVAVHLGGLSADGTYHFRFVVEDQNGSAETPDHSFIFISPPPPAGCPNEALREANDSSRLPDCRAYELITPMQKNGALVGALLFNQIPPGIADDGSTVIAPSIQCFAESTSCVAARVSEGEPFQFTRTSAGWQTRSLALSGEAFPVSSMWRFDPNTGKVLYSAPTPPGEEDDWYVRAPDGSVSDLGALWEGGLTLHTLRQLEPEPTVVSADFSHVLFESQEPFWSFDLGTGAAQGLYESTGGTEPRLLAVSGGEQSHDLIGGCGASVAGRGGFGALSTDGRTAFFQVAKCAHGSGSNTGPVPALELFARIDAEGPAARTVAISEPGQLGQANPACTSAGCIANTSMSNPGRFRSAHFEGAAVDGTRALFTSTQQLTDAAGQDTNTQDNAPKCAVTVGPNGCNLYLYEDPRQQPLTGVHLIDVSAGDSSGLGPQVQGAVAISSDAGHVYFVAKGVLSEAANAQGQHAAEGADNLYLYERDAEHPQGHTAFVATLSVADIDEWVTGASVSGPSRANVSPDGRYLVFTSHRGLTPDARAEGAAQVYRYDAQTGQLARISFGTRGFNDDGNTAGASPSADASLAALSRAVLQRVSPARPDPTMSADGTRVFFQSPVALTPGALSEVPSAGGGELAQNIYEWETAGVGSCGAAETRGCVSLISDGRDTSERSTELQSSVELLGSDASGENVFFATASQLNWADTDSQRDYYDARIEGGFAPPPAQLACQGEACKGQGTEAGAESSPATAGLNAPEEGPKHPVKPKKKRHHKKRHHKAHRRRARHHHRRGDGR
jgi:DNA-binding beta-propeller fold protein YncE